MRTHLAYGYSQPDSFNYRAQLIMLYALQHAQSAFERGITTVRDMSSAHGVCKNLKLAEKKGFIVIRESCIRIPESHDRRTYPGMKSRKWTVRGQSVKKSVKQVRDGAEWVKILTTNREPYPGAYPGKNWMRRWMRVPQKRNQLACMPEPIRGSRCALMPDLTRSNMEPL